MRPSPTMTRMPISVLLLVAAFVVAAPSAAHAYVGPGAGFAFVSSIFIIIFTTFLAILTLLTWPRFGGWFSEFVAVRPSPRPGFVGSWFWDLTGKTRSSPKSSCGRVCSRTSPVSGNEARSCPCGPPS